MSKGPEVVGEGFRLLILVDPMALRGSVRDQIVDSRHTGMAADESVRRET